MLAKDFKDHIILNFELEVKLQYMKWLSQTKEIDIFEVISMLIIFCRASVKAKCECKLYQSSQS